jgi:hypothetical protein
MAAESRHSRWIHDTAWWYPSHREVLKPKSGCLYRKLDNGVASLQKMSITGQYHYGREKPQDSQGLRI